MKPSRRRTRGFKEQVCAKCKHADQRALRKGWDWCDQEYSIRNGHCTHFVPIKPKKGLEELAKMVEEEVRH